MLCLVADCPYKTHAKGYCLRHYFRVRRYGRLERISTDWQELGLKPVYQTDTVIKNALTLASMHKARFGGMRDMVMSRDRYRCIRCGMTRKEHKTLWGRDLTVNHIDKHGRYAAVKNHDPANMETLCLRCHASKDAMRHGRYATYKMKRRSGVFS